VQLNADPDLHFEILRALSSAPYGGSDIGEVLMAAAQIKPGDFESFFIAFSSLANRVYDIAQKIDFYRFPISARNAMFRASTYFRSADFYLHGNPSDPRINSLWFQQAAAFDTALSLLPVAGKRVILEGGSFEIPTIYYAAAGPMKRRPTLIIGGGYDGSQEELYHQMGKAASDRGYNVITYEGPGQATVRRDQSLGFIVEWEKVVTPVVDYLYTLPEVDTSAVALAGLSFGGFLAPRAAAFEHRLAAVIALDGLYEFGGLLLQQFPPTLTALFKTGNQTAFDSAVDAARSNPNTSTKLRWFVDQGTWAFNTPSPFDWMTQLQAYTLEGIVDQIHCPVFVADAQDDLFFPGEGQVLASKLGNRSTYHQFQTADGAGGHAGVGSFVMQNQVTLDWYQNVLENRH
jgi:pimeloyl-ACP methyl ester carboxylesterase